MPESYPPRRSPPRYHRANSPRRRSPSPYEHGYSHSRYARPPSPRSHSRRDDYYHDRDSRYSRYPPDEIIASRYERERYDDRYRYPDRERERERDWRSAPRYRERTPPRDRRRSPTPPRPRRRSSKSRSRSRTRVRSRSRTSPGRERGLTSEVVKAAEPSQGEAGPSDSRLSREGPRILEPNKKERELKAEFENLSPSSSQATGKLKAEENQKPLPTRPAPEQKPLTVKTEFTSSPIESSSRIPSGSSGIPTGPRAHSYNTDSYSARTPTAPQANRHPKGGVPLRQEIQTPVSANARKESTIVHKIPTVVLWDPMKHEDKKRLESIRAERKQEETRLLELQRSLRRSLHEYELTRLDLSAIEKRRALAETQLERLCKIDV